MAASIGSDRIIVSNHGGRRPDCVIAAIKILPQIRDVVHQRVVVMMDGGVRCGRDVSKAIARGAELVFLGRPYMCAATVGGQPGVEHAISLLRD